MDDRKNLGAYLDSVISALNDLIEKIIHSFEMLYTYQIEKKKQLSSDAKIQTGAQFSMVLDPNAHKDSKVVQSVNSFSGKKSMGAVSFASEASQFSEAGFDTIIHGPGQMEQGLGIDTYTKTSEFKRCLSI